MSVVMCFFVLHLLLSIAAGDDDRRCSFTLEFVNGSELTCWDEECSDFVDPISLVHSGHDGDCRTNSLSLKFRSSSSYERFLSNVSFLSSFFRPGRPTLERLLQVELLSPLNSGELFTLAHWKVLSPSSPSHIDTYELIFAGRLTEEEDGESLQLDEETFLSAEQNSIDTLRIHFRCSKDLIVEWELVRSLSLLPPSPCPEQIESLRSNLQLLLPGLGVALLLFVLLVWASFPRRPSLVKKEIEEELIERF